MRDDSSPARRGPLAFQRLCLITCCLIFGLIILGGVVRATDSGLGCGDDWPRCEGSFIPRFEKELLIEYSHRLTASVVGFLVLGIIVWAWRSFRSVPAIFYPSVLAFGLLLFQAGLGAAAVRNELSPEIIAVHLGMALILLSFLILITTAAFAQGTPLVRPHVGRQIRQVALLALGLTFALMLIGSYVAGADYGLACSGWPLCNGEIVPNTGATSVQLVFFHRFLALVVGLVIVYLAWQGLRLGHEAPFIVLLTNLAFGLYMLQALLGAANVWTELADEIRAAHLAFATLLWTTLAILNIRLNNLHEPFPAPARAQPTRPGFARQPR
jgi:cytochrome c oxidase assembly protein subunit 15